MMLALFFQSLIRYGTWWLASLWPGRHQAAPLSTRRLLFLLLFYPAFLALQFLHWLGFLCDELCFPPYRKVEVSGPVFVLGIPRSGTTFLHRTLAEDRSRFTSFTTWEALLAPSITERKLIGVVKSIDRALGAPLRRLTTRILRSTSGDFDDIHKVGLNDPEEDYLSLLPAGGCFIMLLAFPFSPQLRQLGRLDEMPAKPRERLLNFYKRALQRHLYCHPGKRLLSKNAAFASWAGTLRSIFPDAKFLICLREPKTALSSQLSSLAPARSFFGTDPGGRHTTATFTDLYTHFYRSLEVFLDEGSPGQIALVAQSDLKTAPGPTIRSALEQLNLEGSQAIGRTLDALRPAQPSAHHHKPEDFSIDRAKIEDCMDSHYEKMLRSSHRSQPRKE